MIAIDEDMQKLQQLHDDMRGLVATVPSTTERLERYTAIADVVVTSGGVSVGAVDYVKQSLEALIAAPSVSSVNPQWDQGNRAVIELLDELNRRDGTTIVVITHDTSIAASLPRQVSVFDGRISSDSALAGTHRNGGGS